MFIRMISAAAMIGGIGASLLGPPHGAMARDAMPKGKPGVLYSAHFGKAGLKGWVGVPAGVSVSGDVLSFDGSSNSMGIEAPFCMNVRDFAVEAEIEGEGARGQSDDFQAYGVFARQSPHGHDGVFAFSTFGQVAQEAPSGLFFGPDNISGNDVQPGAGYHTYRLEVHGPVYTFSIDAKRVTQFTIRDFARGTCYGIAANNYAIKVRAFRVVRLARSTPKVSPLPALKTLNLTSSDVGLPLLHGHYYTNEETARLRNTTVASIVASGRILSYSAVFQAQDSRQGLVYVASSVGAYTSGEAAHTAYGTAVAGDTSQAGATSKVTTTPGFADETTMISYRPAGRTDVSYFDIDFRQGRYLAVMHVAIAGAYTSDEGKRLSDLAAVLDGRLLGAS